MSDGTFSYNTLSAFVVRGEDGRLDSDATVAKFVDRLAEWESAVEKEDSAIAAAVHEVFDTKIVKGGSLNMDAIVTFAIPALNPNSDNFAILRDRIKDWVRTNADQPAKKSKDGKTVLVEAEAPRTRAFSIAKGKGGGVRRWADVAVKPDSE